MQDLALKVVPEENYFFTGGAVEAMLKVADSLIPMDVTVCVPNSDYLTRWQPFLPQHVLCPVCAGAYRANVILITDEPEDADLLKRRYCSHASVWTFCRAGFRSGRVIDLAGYAARVSIIQGKVLGIARKVLAE